MPCLIAYSPSLKWMNVNLRENLNKYMEYERYISDGLIEKHFFGFTTPEEEEDLQIHLNIFPELQTEMEE